MVMVRTMKKEDFFKQIERCQTSDHFDQNLLDNAAMMFEKWGLNASENDKEHMFLAHGLNDKSDDNESVKKEKKNLRCISSKIMKTQISKDNAVGIMKNFNSINNVGFRWLE
jgi:hypothetical protein